MVRNMSELVRRAISKVQDEPIQLARKAGTPGVDSEGNAGVWVQVETGPLFIRKGETAKTSFERKQKYIERGGFFGPGHKETRRAYKKVWRQAEGDPIMRTVVKDAGLTPEYKTAKALYTTAKVGKDIVYQEIMSKRKMGKFQTRVRNLNEKLKGMFEGSAAYKKVVKMRDVYRRVAIKYGKNQAAIWRARKGANAIVQYGKEKAGLKYTSAQDVIGNVIKKGFRKKTGLEKFELE